jgi:uncharacterized membrane protein
MAKVSITMLTFSTALVLVAFGKGMSVLRGGDVESHFYWAMAALLSVLAANLMAIVHAAQSDRIIHELRRRAEESALGEHPETAVPEGGSPRAGQADKGALISTSEA